MNYETIITLVLAKSLPMKTAPITSQDLDNNTQFLQWNPRLIGLCNNGSTVVYK